MYLDNSIPKKFWKIQQDEEQPEIKKYASKLLKPSYYIVLFLNMEIYLSWSKRIHKYFSFGIYLSLGKMWSIRQIKLTTKKTFSDEAFLLTTTSLKFTVPIQQWL